MKSVKIIILGGVGTGKTTIAGIIEEALKMYSIKVTSITDTIECTTHKNIIDEPMHYKKVFAVANAVEATIEITQSSKID